MAGAPRRPGGGRFVAFRMYRNYNGRGGAFSVARRAVGHRPIPDSLCTRTRSADGALTVMVSTVVHSRAVVIAAYTYGQGYRCSRFAAEPHRRHRGRARRRQQGRNTYQQISSHWSVAYALGADGSGRWRQ